MLKIDNYEVVGWDHAIRGMRNPKNSWDKSDSGWNELVYAPFGPEPSDEKLVSIPVIEEYEDEYYVGPADQRLMEALRDGGPVHAKYRRMITVYLDITAPLYWWKEFDTYKVGTVANSCSTMHKIHAKEFTLDDFSTEHLIGGNDVVTLSDELKEHLDIEERYTLENHVLATGEHDALPIEYEDRVEYLSPKDILEQYVIGALNLYRKKFFEAKRKLMKEEAKRYWWQMIQLLPSSYNQKRTIMLSYEVLANMYRWRRDHKLDEWHTFCDWIESLPYSELITGKEKGR